MTRDVHEAVGRLLEACSTLSLATVDEAGLPHAANVNFVSGARDEALRLYWLSAEESAHSRHIEREPRVAATAYPPFTEPAEIRGVQIHGEAAVVGQEHFDALWRLFCGKFAYAAAMERRARQQRFYVLRPRWVRLIDNGVRFGFKQEWEIPPDEGVSA